MLCAIFGQGGFAFLAGAASSFPSSLRKMAEGGGREWLPVHVLAVSPRELTGTAALKRGIPPGARAYTNTGHGAAVVTSEHEQRGGFISAVVDAAAFSSVDKQKMVASCRADRQATMRRRVVRSRGVTCKSHSSNIVDVLSDFVDKAQTEFDDTRHAGSNAAHNFSMLQQSLEDQLAQLNRPLKKADVAELQKTGWEN